MAVKKNLKDIQQTLLAGGQITYDEMFDTQNALDNGASPFAARTGSWHQDGGLTSHGSDGFTYDAVNKDNLGTILGSGSAIAAYKKRKTDQKNTAAQGIGRSQTILGGTVV